MTERVDNRGGVLQAEKAEGLGQHRAATAAMHTAPAGNFTDERRQQVAEKVRDELRLALVWLLRSQKKRTFGQLLGTVSNCIRSDDAVDCWHVWGQEGTQIDLGMRCV